MDKLGNEATLAVGDYVVDKTKPSVSFSPEGNEQPARSRQVMVTLTDAKSSLGESYYVWTEDLTAPEPDDERWTVFYSGGNDSYTAEINTPDGVTGTWYLHIKSSDELGNTGIATAGGGFLLDNIGPELSFSPNGNLSNVRSISTRLNITDNITSRMEDFIIKYLIDKNATTDGDDSTWLTSADGLFTLADRTGAYYIHVKVYDEAGNASIMTSAPFHLDNAPPTGSINIVKDYTNSTEVQVEFSANHTADPIEKGGIEYAYAVNGGEWSQWEQLVATRTISLGDAAEGSHEIRVKYRDEMGNESVVYKDFVVYDITPPAADISYSTTYWTNRPVQAVITFSDNLCPADQIVVTNNNGSTIYEFLENGSFTFEFMDAAGNVSSATATVTNIDREKPNIAISPDGDSTRRRTASAKIEAADNITASEHIRIFYQWSASNVNAPGEWIAAQSGEEASKLEGDGLWYLWVKAVDEAGNETVYSSQAFMLDNTPPVGTITYVPDKRTAGPVTVYLSVNEPVIVTAPAGDVREYTFYENGEFTFEFIDEVGLTGKVTAVVDYIDKSLPSYHVSYSETGWTNQPVLVTVDVSGDPPREVIGISSDVNPELVNVVKREDESVIQAVYKFTQNGRLDFIVNDIETGIWTEGNAIVRNIDTTMPVYRLEFSETGWTNKDVTVMIYAEDDDGSEVQIQDAVGQPVSNTHVFTENGTYTFYLRDKAGNILPVPVTVSNIDKTAPVPVITYSNDGRWTNQDVTATITFINETEPVTILNNGGSNTYTFTRNGEFTFHYVDIAGNEGQFTAVVDKIDRVSPVGSISYMGFDFNWTNRDVTVKLMAYDDKSSVTILNNGGSDEYTFTRNGEFTFEFSDEAGNIGTATAIMSRIDKDPPAAEIQYSITTPTNTAVIATVIADEPVTIINNGGIAVYHFTDNGRFTFEMTDRAGNMASKTAVVDWIDKTPPIPTLKYSTTEKTKDDVIVTVDANEDFYVINNARKTQRIFTENGSFVFYISDMAGNTAEIEAVVNNIDKSKAKITLEYSETEPTQKDVKVTIRSDRPVTAQNIDGVDDERNPYVLFERNGTRWVDLTDSLGNKTELRIEVKNIDREAPVISFLEGESLIVEMGSEVQPLSDVTVTDNLDGDLASQLVVSHNIDSNIPGEYKITYTVTDRAGNTAHVIRRAVVIPVGEFSVYINSGLPENGEILIEGSSIGVKVFGAKGEVTTKWAKGKVGESSFKKIDNLVENGNLEVDGSGYYTIFVQDQERQTILVHVYVIYR